ncbi:MAG TPA: pyruvate dehydrogenase complex dihydrolipoamide acetyltransferase [Polyangia bacterium]|nr:pyruvate dehydrogenase complex dihydrolipoamide acetyltransferase [Polyangia bacterium]
MASIITMPRLSPTMEEGVLAKWTKKEGDKITPGDIIAEVETDKANMEFPIEDEGVLLKLLVSEGDTVKLGDPVAVMGDAGEDPAAAMKDFKAPARAEGAAKAEAKPEAAPKAAPAKAEAKAEPAKAEAKAAPAVKGEPSKAAAPVPKTTAAANGNGHGRVLASPFARKLALEKGVDLRGVAGSGPRGRIVRRDIDEAAANPSAESADETTDAVETRGPSSGPAGAGDASRQDTIAAPSQMRKTIARRLVEAKREIPHIYLTMEATVDKLFAMREQLNELGDVKVSVNDLVVKALALALRKIPAANVSWTAEGIVKHGAANVGIAVSLPDNGLITPIIRDADLKSIGAVARETKSLAERARGKKLQPHEYSGGSATVSNLGMYGIKEFVAIINPPESVILAVGTTEKRPVVVEKDGHDVVEIARRMSLTLSCDHRVVDGVLGAQLLGEIVKLLEKPMGMLL